MKPYYDGPVTQVLTRVQHQTDAKPLIVQYGLTTVTVCAKYLIPKKKHNFPTHVS